MFRRIVKQIGHLTLIALLLAGCREGEEGGAIVPQPVSGDNTDRRSSITDDNVWEINAYVNYDWAVPQPWPDSLEGYPTLQYVQDKLGVRLDWTAPGGSAEDALNRMIESRSLPDVIQLDRGPATDRLAKADLLVPLDAYYAKYPNLRKYIGEQSLNLLRAEDGRIYGIPQYYADENSMTSGSGWFVQQNIYKSLGSPKLETFDDLYRYLKAVQKRFPDVVPLDTLAAEGWSQLNGMVYAGYAEGRTPTIAWRRAGGQLISVYEDPDYVAAMQYVSRLYREKLLAQDLLTDRLEQIKDKLNGGSIAVYAGIGIGNDIRRANVALNSGTEDNGYMVIWPIHKPGLDKTKVVTQSVSRLGWNFLTITSSAADPERIFKFFDDITAPEHQRVLSFGPEGLFWEGTDNGAPIPNERYKTTPRETLDRMKIEWNPLFNMPLIQTWSIIREKYYKEQDNFGTITNRTILDETLFDSIDPPPGSPEGLIKKQTDEIIGRVNADIHFARSDEEVERMVELAKKELDKAGYPRLLAYMTKRWHDNERRAGGS